MNKKNIIRLIEPPHHFHLLARLLNNNKLDAEEIHAKFNFENTGIQLTAKIGSSVRHFKHFIQGLNRLVSAEE